jgi:hypothetical protein
MQPIFVVTRSGSRWLPFFCCAVIVVVALRLQLHEVDGAFLSDDYGPLDGIFRASRSDGLWAWAISNFYPRAPVANFAYRPLTWTTFIFDWFAFGANATGWRVTNVVIFVTNAAIAGFLAARWTKRGRQSARRAGMVAAGAMIAYPFAGEVSAWPIGRIDLLPCFFSLLYLWTLSLGSNSTLRLHLLRALCLLLALMSKESAIPLPVTATFLTLAIGPLQRPGYRIGPLQRVQFALIELWPTWLLFGLYLLLRAFLFGSFLRVYTAVPPPGIVEFIDRLGTFRFLVAGNVGPAYVLWSVLSITILLVLLFSWLVRRDKTPFQCSMITFALAGSSLLYFVAPASNLPLSTPVGEGARQFYVGWLYVSLLVGMLSAWTLWQWLCGSAFALLMLGGQAHSLSQWHFAAAQMKQIVSGIGNFAAKIADDQYALLLLPDHVGVALFARNAQGVLVERPTQRADYIDRMIVVTSADIQSWTDYAARGGVAKLKGAAFFDPAKFLGIYCWNVTTQSITQLTHGGAFVFDAATLRLHASQRFDEVGCLGPF